MLIKLVEIKQLLNSEHLQEEETDNKQYRLSEVYINPEHIVCVREDLDLKESVFTGDLAPEGLDKRHSFIRINLQRGQVGMDIIIVEEPDSFLKKINGGSKQNVIWG